MTTDDSLLLSDLDRIANNVDGAVIALDDYDDYEHDTERLKVIAGDLGAAMSHLRRASREMVDLRERLERRLRG